MPPVFGRLLQRLLASYTCISQLSLQLLLPSLTPPPFLPSPGLTPLQDCWQQLQAVHTAVAPYRDAALDRWHRRTVLMNGLGPGAGSRLKALNQSVSAQVGPL